MSFRTYRDVAGADRSRLGEQVGAQRARIAARLAHVRATVGVMSGKGGVGKSYVTAALAKACAARLGWSVGVLDGDLRSPTIGRLLGVSGPVQVGADGVQPAITSDGIRVMSTSLLLAEGAPLAWREHPAERFVWRGVMEAGALREFLGDVTWGALDLLLVDLPPGGDRLSDLAELHPALSGAIVVTIPSEESYESVRRSMHGARAAGIPMLGVVENMYGYACGECAVTQPLFDGDAGPRLAEEFGVPLLARLAFRPTAQRDLGALAHGDAMAGLLAALRSRESRSA